MMTFLVTGGAGFIGRWLTTWLLEEGHRVVVVDDLSGVDDATEWARFSLLAGHLDYWPLSVAEFADSPHLPPCDVLVHLAADPAECLSQYTPVRHTVHGALAAAQAAQAAMRCGCRRLVLASSIAVYNGLEQAHVANEAGFAGQKFLWDETSRLRPHDIYGANKACAEAIFAALAETHGLTWAAARMHNVVGPGQSLADPYRNVAAIWTRALLTGQPLVIYEGMFRQFSPVCEVAAALGWLAGNDWQGVLNLGAEAVCSLEQLAEVLCAAAGKDMSEVTLELRPARQREANIAVCSHDLQGEVLPPALRAVLTDEGRLLAALHEAVAVARTIGGYDGQGFPALRWREVEVGRERLPVAWRPPAEATP